MELNWRCPECQVYPATYVICTTPRSGSWLLSDGLAATGLAGNPREWFNVLEEREHRDKYPRMTYPQYVKFACSRSHTANGISGIKLHHYQLVALTSRLEAMTGRGAHVDADELMKGLFPAASYIWLGRRDKRQQAVSYLRAKGSGEWWAFDDDGTLKPDFGQDAIAKAEAVFRRGDSYWQDFFIRNDVEPPLTLCYEDDLAQPSDYRRTIARVLEHLGVPSDDVIIPPPRLHKQG